MCERILNYYFRHTRFQSVKTTKNLEKDRKTNQKSTLTFRSPSKFIAKSCEFLYIIAFSH